MALGRNGFSGADINAETYTPPDMRQVDAKSPIAIVNGTDFGDDRFSGNGRAGSAPAGSGIPMENAGGAAGDMAVPSDQNLCRTINPYGIPKG